MDYILDIITTLFKYSRHIIMLVVIFKLIKFYKEREENENYLVLKLIGFYLLGAFTFNIDISMKIIIPVGYGIYCLYMKEKDRANKEIKHKSANLGIIVLGIGIVCGFIYNGLEYRDRFVKTSNNSVKAIEQDYKLIEEKLKLNDYITPNRFSLEYDGDTIKTIDYSFVIGEKSYNVYKSKDEDGYTININKYDNEINSDWFGFYNYDELEATKIEIKELLRAVSNIKFDKNKTDEKIVYYHVTYDENNYSTGSEQGENGNTTYYIDDYEKYTYKEAKKRELPMDGAIIWFSPMKEMENNTEENYGTESIYTDSYVLYPRKNQNLIDEDISYLKIKDLRNNKEETLNSEDDYDKMYDLLCSFDFASWEEQNADFNVEDDVILIINDDTDVSLEFYKNQEYVRYKSSEENVIYRINKYIYDEVIRNIP